MWRRLLFGFLFLFCAALGAGFLLLPAPEDPRTTLPPVPAGEQQQLIEAMKPPRRARPVIAVVADNAGTETTDFLIPYGVLAESNAAEVIAVAPERGPVRLRPALTIEPQATFAELDARFPEGADYVVMPKIEATAEPRVVAFLKAQAAKGAVIVGICSGAQTLSAAGFLEGRRATGHWFDLDGLRAENPTMQWVPDRRYVADRGVVTTTGVSASLPVSLALIEAFAGRARAEAVARKLGVASWDARHASEDFRLDRRTLGIALVNRYLTGTSDLYAIPVEPGVDEISLGFTADAWSRTERSRARTVSSTLGPVVTRRGLTLLPDLAAPPRGGLAKAAQESEVARALPEALEAIAWRYGPSTARYVALQLELAWRP